MRHTGRDPKRGISELSLFSLQEIVVEVCGQSTKSPRLQAVVKFPPLLISHMMGWNLKNTLKKKRWNSWLTWFPNLEAGKMSQKTIHWTISQVIHQLNCLFVAHCHTSDYDSVFRLKLLNLSDHDYITVAKKFLLNFSCATEPDDCVVIWNDTFLYGSSSFSLKLVAVVLKSVGSIQVSKLAADPSTSYQIHSQLFPESCKTNAESIGIKELYGRMILPYTREYSINFFLIWP